MASSPSTPPPQAPPTRRYIYNDVDMEHFLQSDAKSELLRMTAAMGKSCSSSKVLDYKYDPHSPLVGLSPAMASLHGSLRGMMVWLDDYPPTDQAKARFGNPAFRQWHTQRLVERSVAIMQNIIQTYEKYPEQPNKEYDASVLQKASDEGYQFAVDASTVIELDNITDDRTRSVVTELCAYFCAAFGHEIRIDYGTGHECSFQVLLYSLCKLGCFGGSTSQPPSEARLKAITISIYSAYLQVTRQIQMEYMLEPAGSHGVWGLDDYHCLPFYFGACQLQAGASAEQDDDLLSSPSSIHNDSILQRYGDRYLYYGCIRYIKQLKKGVPFFESSPMLNDISQSLPTWSKVASGLLRLFEGEVLKKRQVVQHFVFGNIFKANWVPSEGEERSAPSTTFRTMATSSAIVAPPPPPVQASVGPMARAPWNEDTGNPPSSPVSPSRQKAKLNLSSNEAVSGLMPVTRAPWATDDNDESGGGSMPPPTKAPWAK